MHSAPPSQRSLKTSPDFADGSHVTAALVEEITFEEHQAVLASLPAFCLGDANLDRGVNVDDLLAVITAVTVPMSSACTGARSPLSAKNSMNRKMRPALKNNTSHSGVGITPTAPWIRSLRASSRADV